MNTSNLETFLMVSKTSSFSKAAELLYVTQSTVSSRVKALEEELGVQLFYRDKQSVSLSPVGEYFMTHAKEIYRMMKKAEEEVLIFDTYKERLSICAPESIWRHSFNAIISEFQSNYPNVAVGLSSGNSEDVIQGILSGLVDIGVVFNKVMSNDLYTIPFCQSRFELCGVPAITNNIDYITPDNLSKFPFIYCDWGISLEKWYNLYYKKRSHFCEIEGTSLFLDYILDGKGIGFLPDRITEKYIKSGRLEEIPFMYSEYTPIDQSYIVFLPYKKEKVEKFLKIALSYKEQHLK